MYLVSHQDVWGEDSFPVAIASTREIAEAIIERLQSAADPVTEYVYYNGYNVDTHALCVEYVPEWTENWLHEEGRMSC